MHKCLAYTPYYIQHSENSEYEPGQKLKKIGLAIGFTEITILSLFKTAWFPALHEIHFMLSYVE